MAKFANVLVLDGGSDLIRTRAGTASRVKQHIVKAYTAGDSYATVTGNSVGVVDMAAGDFTQSGAAGAARTTTVAAKAGVSLSNSGATPDLHFAIVDSVSSDVLYVTDETTNQQTFAGNTGNIPSWTFSFAQPT